MQKKIAHMFWIRQIVLHTITSPFRVLHSEHLLRTRLELWTRNILYKTIRLGLSMMCSIRFWFFRFWILSRAIAQESKLSMIFLHFFTDIFDWFFKVPYFSLTNLQKFTEIGRKNEEKPRSNRFKTEYNTSLL